ncbi:DUF3883 domain-containing protein [Rivibacter subsaxonicus]|uniref:Uncharacterized protein DUF3883 n=1 Tax=Rivibacter subsaxonicus TaxID=457575 RepID=A0A4Q7VX70_9BURK|nr:DUF3883 domain-containing protein [Rivibacter subsaxonicus]RZU00919.1 uncharacterized protein DUF3883 [Rivibacter subsaxonicus]
MTRRLSDLTSSAAVQAALDEFAGVGRDAFLAKHGFGRSRSYVVVDPRSGIEADSKAIAGVAFGIQFPEEGPLRPSDFSGGDATVVSRLQSLGFIVKSLLAETAGDDWRREEVELIVADYLAMLTLELTGQHYNKTAHRRRLLELLNGRSNGSVEFKHGNISAVMLELGFPYLRGYKPRANFQRRLLTEVVSEQVQRHRVLDDAAMAAALRPVEKADVSDFSRVKAPAPQRALVAREQAAIYGRLPIKRDYLQREAQNRALGLAGEEFALSFERWRLAGLGAGQLAERVEHVSRTQGDGLGFDIQSFEVDGRARYIEVKTTAFGERTPFFASANEVRFAQENTEQFRLYRLFDFRAAPRLFELAGAIERHCSLDPATYRASFD